MSTHTLPDAPAVHMEGGKFLTFFLDDEEYGVEILKVREIIGLLPITRVPRMPPAIRGVINLRGKVIPIMDMRLRFEMEAVAASERTCIIVVHAGGLDFGVIVDRVSEVADIATEEIEPTPAVGSVVDTSYLLGVAKSAGRVKLLLDIDRVLTAQEAVAIAAADEAGAEPEDD